MASLVVLDMSAANCSFTLYPGWNQVGLSCRPVNKTPQNFTWSTGNITISIHAWYAGDEDDPWKVFNPHLPYWVEMDLERMDRYHGYWINANETGIANFSGWLTVPTELTLQKGKYYMFGWPHLETRDIRDAMAPIVNKHLRLYAYNETKHDWKIWYPYRPWLGQEFMYMGRQEAFWMEMDEEGVWLVE